MKKSVCNLFTLAVLFTFAVVIISCGKEANVEKKTNVPEKKEQVKKDTNKTVSNGKIKSKSEIVIFEADYGVSQTVKLSDCKDFDVKSQKDFISNYMLCENGYEKSTEKILEEVKDVPDQIIFGMKKGKIEANLNYFLNGDYAVTEDEVKVSKFENDGNKFTLNFNKKGKESILTGKLLYVEMKPKGWKGNIMKVLLVESGNSVVIYFVGPDWAG